PVLTLKQKLPNVEAEELLKLAAKTKAPPTRTKAAGSAKARLTSAKGDHSIKVYNAKRDFTQTSEPPGATKEKKSKELLFVIQKHQASRLHYDFRLEMDGVLRSWAVP